MRERDGERVYTCIARPKGGGEGVPFKDGVRGTLTTPRTPTYLHSLEVVQKGGEKVIHHTQPGLKLHPPHTVGQTVVAEMEDTKFLTTRGQYASTFLQCATLESPRLLPQTLEYGGRLSLSVHKEVKKIDE